MPCPSPNALQELVLRALGPEERSRLEEHLDECSSCRRVVAALLQEEVAPSAASAEPSTLVDPAKAGEAAAEPKPAGTLFPSTNLAPGSTIAGRYKVQRRLGAGGMGVVFLAERLDIAQLVAIKVLHPAYSADPDAVRRFENEAQACARLRHPHAVSLHDFGRDEAGEMYLVMEYVEGESLRALLRRQGRLTPEAAVDIALQLCDVLGQAHARGIIHRDLKPENVMLSPGLRGYHARVLDFGVSKLRGRHATEAGAILGTLAYMAPEQLEGGEIDDRVDIHAVGLMLFEMLTGRRPFSTRGLTLEQILELRSREPLPALADSGAHVSEALERVIQKAAARAPDDRFRTTAELALALAEAGVAAPPPAARSRLPGGLGLAAGLGLLVGLVAFVSSGERTREAPPTATPPVAVLPADPPDAEAAAPTPVDAGRAEPEQETEVAPESPAVSPPAADPGPRREGKANRARGSGTVSFRVSPWAYVEIDGRRYGATPFARPLTLPEGAHRVRLTNPELKKDVVRPIRVLAGREVVVRVDLYQ